MRYLFMVLMLLFTGEQSIYADSRPTELTSESCKVAITLTQEAMKMFRKGANRYEVMDMINNYKAPTPNAYAGKVYTQLNVVDIKKNIDRAYKDNDIIQATVSSCGQMQGFKFTRH